MEKFTRDINRNCAYIVKQNNLLSDNDFQSKLTEACSKGWSWSGNNKINKKTVNQLLVAQYCKFKDTAKIQEPNEIFTLLKEPNPAASKESFDNMIKMILTNSGLM